MERTNPEKLTAAAYAQGVRIGSQNALRDFLEWLDVDPVDLKYGFEADEACDAPRAERVVIGQEIVRRIEELSQKEQ